MGNPTFSCPKCEQEYTGRVEHIGLEMECAECGEAFRIPNFLNVAKAEAKKEEARNERPQESVSELNTPVVESLGQEQIQLLKQEGEELVRKLSELKKRHCWEFAIIGLALNNRLAPIKKLIVETQHEPTFQWGFKKNRAKYNTFIQQHSRNYFKCLVNLSSIMAQDLENSLLKEDVKRIFKLMGKLDGQLNYLREFHEKTFSEPVHPDDVYVKLQSTMAEWAPFACQSFDVIIKRLIKSSTEMRDSVSYKPQVSFVPPNIYQFFKIAGNLNIGFDRPKTVIADLS